MRALVIQDEEGFTTVPHRPKPQGTMISELPIRQAGGNQSERRANRNRFASLLCSGYSEGAECRESCCTAVSEAAVETGPASECLPGTRDWVQKHGDRSPVPGCSPVCYYDQNCNLVHPCGRGCKIDHRTFDPRSCVPRTHGKERGHGLERGDEELDKIIKEFEELDNK